MWDGGSAYGGGTSIGGGDSIAGMASEAWVNGNFVSIEFFSKLFQAYGPAEEEGDPDVAVNPNDLESTISNIKAQFGLWTEQYLSALGLGDGGGGGTQLNEPLNSINTAGLADHPSGSGQTIVWNGSAWVYGTAGGAVGVTSVAMSMPTGFTVTGTPITSSGTLAVTFASGYSLPTDAKQTNWDTAYGWGNHATAGYAMATDVYSKTDADGRFLTISFFRSLFKAYQSNGITEVTPNAGDTSLISSIKAMFGFWTDQYLSALGQGSGGGGSITLNEPLNGINNASLGSPSSAGQTLVWNGSAWKYSSAAGITATSLNIGGSASISGLVTAAGGFSVSGKDNTYVVLAGGGTKLLSEIGGGGTVSSIIINGTTTPYTPDVNGVVMLPAYPVYNFIGTTFYSGNSGSSTEHDCNNITNNGHYYYNSNGPTTVSTAHDGALYAQAYSNIWVGQIAQDYRDGRLYVRGKNSDTWMSWLRIAVFSEIPTKVSDLTNDTGFITGASLANYLPLSGGTLTSYNNILTIKSTTDSGWIYFFVTKNNTASAYGAVGYQDNFAFITNVKTGNARIGVADDGTPEYRITASGTTNTYKLWNESNDGAGSGLDADLLDGQHASYYATAASLGDYLPLTGGTITGTLTVSYSTTSGMAPAILIRHPNYSDGAFQFASDSLAANLPVNGYYVHVIGKAHTSYGSAYFGFRNVSESNTSLNYATIGMFNSNDLLVVQGGGNVGIGVTSPSYKLHVNGYAYTTRLYLASGVYLEKDSTGVHLVGAGFYSDSFVTALGQGSGGGGSVTLNEPLNGINNASLGSPSSAGQTLVWNGSAWKYSSAAGITATSLNIGGSASISGVVTAAGGFSVSGKDNTYVVMAGGGTKPLSEFTGTGGTVTGISVNGGSVVSPISGIVPLTGIVTSIAISGTTNPYTPSSGVVTLPAYPVYNFIGTTFYSGNSGSSTEHDCNNITNNGHYYYNSNGPTTVSTAHDGALYAQAYSNIWVGQIAQDYRDGRLYVRGKNSDTWMSWLRIAVFSEIPTKVSDLTNDTGFITGASLANYLPLSGGTLTSYNNILTIKSTTDSGWIYFFVTKNNTASAYGAVGYQDNFAFITNVKTGNARIGVADDGTPEYRITASGTTNTYKLWNESNDGAGSGLDADLLDGQHASYFAVAADNATQTWVTSQGYSKNFYGTTFYSGGASHSEHNCNNIENNGHYYYSSNGPATTLGASTNDGALYAQAYSTNWVGQIAQDFRNGRLFVRGKSNGTWTSWLVVMDSGNIGSYNAGSATKLQTSRTIWGQSFDGTANVEGTLQLERSAASSYGRISFYTSTYHTWYIYMQNAGVASPTSVNAPSGTYVTSWALRTLIQNSSGMGWTWESCTESSSSTPAIKMELSSNTGNLHVAGVVNTDTGLYSAGYVTAASDIRKKNQIGDCALTVKEVALAPSIRFTWKDERIKGVQVGSVAQYWLKVLPEAVREDADGMLTMDYGVIALLSSIATARKLEDVERRVTELERENEQLKKQLKAA